MKNKHTVWISKCCKAEAIIEMSPDFIGDDPKHMEIGTCHFICGKCHKPCDVKINKRITMADKPKGESPKIMSALCNTPN